MTFKNIFTISSRMLVSCIILSANNVFAQTVERIYAANSCQMVANFATGGTAQHGTMNFRYDSTEAMDTGTVGSSSGISRIVCPIVRQKTASSKGAKFYVYLTQTQESFGDLVSCTMTSRRPHNGALVSSGTRNNTGQAGPEVVLARSIAPSSTWGHYSLQCTSDNTFPDFQGYRIKEF